MEKKNIFISSTYVDLQDYRKEVWELLSGYKNINILGMEKFGARKETPLETCLDAVSRADIYIAIIAERFGSIEQNSNKSYTQLEYEKALKENKEILIYLIDEDNALIKPKNSDHGDNYNLLKNFKQQLREKHTVDFFKDPKDLSEKIKNRLNELIREIKEIIDINTSFNESESIIKKFHLFPNKYNNKEVKLKIKLEDNIFPLSKQVCNELNFKFGETVALSFKLIEPKMSIKIDYIIIEADKSDFYFKNTNDEEINIIAKLIFSEKPLRNTKAYLKDENYPIKIKNPDYNPYRNSYDYNDYIVGFNNLSNPKYINEYRTIESDCSLFLELIKQIEK